LCYVTVVSIGRTAFRIFHTTAVIDAVGLSFSDVELVGAEPIEDTVPMRPTNAPTFVGASKLVGAFHAGAAGNFR
jgi:hypothetical protein